MLKENYWLIPTYLGKGIVCASKIEVQSSNVGGCGHILHRVNFAENI